MFVGAECIFIIFVPFDLSFTLNKREGYHSYIFCYFLGVSQKIWLLMVIWGDYPRWFTRQAIANDSHDLVAMESGLA